MAEKIIVDIQKPAWDIYDSTPVYRKAILRQCVTNDKGDCVQLNLKVKHYIEVDNQLVYVPLRYPDLFVSVNASEGQYVIVEGTDLNFVHGEEIFTENVLNEGLAMGTNVFPILDFLDGIRNSNNIYNDVISKVIIATSNDGDCDKANFLKYTL